MSNCRLCEICNFTADILQIWKSEDSPSQRHWLNELTSYCTPDKIVYNVRRNPATFEKIWDCLYYHKCTLVTKLDVVSCFLLCKCIQCLLLSCLCFCLFHCGKKKRCMTLLSKYKYLQKEKNIIQHDMSMVTNNIVMNIESSWKSRSHVFSVSFSVRFLSGCGTLIVDLQVSGGLLTRVLPKNHLCHRDLTWPLVGTQVLYHHLCPREGAVVVWSVLWVAFSLSATRPNPYLVQDVI